MIKSILMLVACAALASPAAASDRRIVSKPYNADEVVQIDGQAGVQASIAFAPDEQIENVAIGDSGSWQVTPNKRANMLFVKPLAPRARTNMTVVTSRRVYYFDLVAAPTARPIYMLRFAYPDEPKEPETPPETAALDPVETQLADGEKPIDPSKLNFAWSKRGDARLFPDQVYDDGQMTYLSWPAGASQPAILVRDERGTEGPVNYAVRDDVIVIEGVPPTILLRSGKSSALLELRTGKAPKGKKGK